MKKKIKALLLIVMIIILTAIGLMKIVKAVWLFCSFLFVPQRRPKEY